MTAHSRSGHPGGPTSGETGAELQLSGERFVSQRGLVIGGRDALEEATEILEEPSKNIKRKILISVNLIVGSVVLLHAVIQLATQGQLPAPARDNIVLPLIILVNYGSAAYNLWVLRGEHRERARLDGLTRWVSIGLIQLNNDGTPKDGDPNTPGVQTIATYDQNVISGFAQVFTGWNYSTCVPPSAPEGASLNWWDWEYCPSGPENQD